MLLSELLKDITLFSVPTAAAILISFLAVDRGKRISKLTKLIHELVYGGDKAAGDSNPGKDTELGLRLTGFIEDQRQKNEYSHGAARELIYFIHCCGKLINQIY
jgi:hypothetical protein